MNITYYDPSYDEIKENKLNEYIDSIEGELNDIIILSLESHPSLYINLKRLHILMYTSSCSLNARWHFILNDKDNNDAYEEAFKLIFEQGTEKQKKKLLFTMNLNSLMEIE